MTTEENPLCQCDHRRDLHDKRGSGCSGAVSFDEMCGCRQFTHRPAAAVDCPRAHEHGHDQIGLTFGRLRAANTTRLKESFPECGDWGAADWLVALVAEVGELADVLDIMKRAKLPPSSSVGISKSLVGIQTHLDLLAARFDIDLGKATISEFNILSANVGSDVRL